MSKIRALGVPAILLASTVTAACGSRAPEPKQPAPETEPAVPAPANAAAAAAPADDARITIGTRATLRSTILGEERPYLVYTPPGYDAGDQRYPVIYLLDGDAHFHHATGIAEFLSAENRMPPAIVVGIANTDRSRDLTPTRQPEPASSGGADRFLEFLASELIPRIERDYRTAGLRILAGHSFGGLFAVHALISRPELFDLHIAASPSLQWDGELMAKRIEPLLAGTIDEHLYFTLGTEPAEITAGNRHFAELLAKRAPKTLRWTFELMEAEDHGSVVHRTIYRGLETFFAPWRLPRAVATAAEIEAHYQRVSKAFKLDARPPEGTVNLLGYRHLLADPPDLAKARELFELNVKLYPDSANVHDSLGESFERAGDLEAALASYERAVARSKPGEPFHEAFVANRDRVAAAVRAKTGGR
jgi:hypothetical protein